MRLPDTFDVGTIGAVSALLSMCILAAYSMLLGRELAGITILLTKRRKLWEVCSVLVYQYIGRRDNGRTHLPHTVSPSRQRDCNPTLTCRKGCGDVKWVPVGRLFAKVFGV